MKAKPLPKLLKKCANCATVFEYKHKNRFYCSQKCCDAKRHRDNYQKRKTIEGRDAPCSSSSCNKLVRYYPRHIKAGSRRYCSYICMSEGMSSTPLQVCELCGKSYYVKRLNRYLRNRRFCSSTCRGAAATKAAEIRNATNPPSKGVLNRRIRYSKKMQEWRNAVFARDEYTCTACGITGGYLQADHIKPFAYFESLRFELSNGRTLCRDCHKKTDTYGRKAVTLYAKD